MSAYGSASTDRRNSLVNQLLSDYNLTFSLVVRSTAWEHHRTGLAYSLLVSLMVCRGRH